MEVQKTFDLLDPIVSEDRMFNLNESKTATCKYMNNEENHLNHTFNGIEEIQKNLNLSPKKDERIGKLSIDSPIDTDINSDSTDDTTDDTTDSKDNYNSYADSRNPSFNMWTREFDDKCNYENRLKIGSKPMKYYVNQYNSPQTTPFMEFTVIGNQKSSGIRNEFERAIPTRLNPVYPVQVLPYQTTPFLGASNPNRMYTETSSHLRWNSDIRNKKSEIGNTEKNFNRFDPGVQAQTVQNAGQFVTPGSKFQSSIGQDGYYNYEGQNNVIFGNSAVPYWGISSRDLLKNIAEMSGC